MSHPTAADSTMGSDNNPAAPTGTVFADLVLRGGLVLSLDPADSRGEGLAVQGGRIIEVGDEAAIARHIGPNTRVIDLHGRTVLPGINDSHLHATWYGAGYPHVFFGPDPEGAKHLEQLLAPHHEARRQAILRAADLLAGLGITSYTEPGLGPGEDAGTTGCFGHDVIDVYRELAAEGKLKQRVTVLGLYGILDGPSNLATVEAGIAELTEAQGESDPAWLRITGLKIFGDLIPLSKQAWISGHYLDGTQGGLLVEGDSIDERQTALQAMVRTAHLAGLQVGVHATGDRTIQAVLDAIAEAEATPGAASARTLGHYLIHADLMTREQVHQAAALGVRINTQAGIAAGTGEWLAGTVGPELAAEAWQLEAALEAGILALSSDAPILAPDWRQGIAAAESRIVQMGGSPEPEAAARRLHGLLRAYTATAAEQDLAGDWKGTIETGKVADLVVLDANPYDVGAAGMPEVGVTLTIVDGRVVFEAE